MRAADTIDSGEQTPVTMTLSGEPGPLAPASSRHALPDPGPPVPALALPTVGLFLAALAVFVVSTWAALNDRVPPQLTILVNAVACFAMFTVGHDASHYSISRTRWVNGLLGRLAVPFVSPAVAFPTFAYIHIEHHRHSNDDENDPDTFASHGVWWQLPVRWLTLDLSYGVFYLRNLSNRPKREVAETGFLFVASVTGIAVAVATGHFWMLAVVYLIPERIAVFFLAWWFDWLPHHGLRFTQRENRYGATRNRVGMEWLFTPLMLSQNYHLVHHLHPSIPFYRYLSTWRRNEEAYLERDAAISTVFGQELNPQEYRAWKELNRKLLRLLPVRMPKGSSSTHAVFHKLPVADVTRLTEDSVLISFDVPDELKKAFAFDHGQHVTVRTNLGGEGVRRNYSICSASTARQLRIAVKHIPGGAFSTFAMQQLKAGDVLELMTPTGQFGTELTPLAEKHYVAIVAGSGITPVLSIVATTLEIETESRFTLIYGNRTRESTMFRAELDELESRFADRLEILHVLSRDPLHTPLLSGRIDRQKLERWLPTTLSPETVDEWFLCGPIELVTMTRDLLLEHGVGPDRVHVELFFGYSDGAAPAREHTQAATVTFRLSGEQQTVELVPGDSILEAALQVRSDAPYACMGGACGTCRAKLLDGTVQMDQNFALGKEELERGYVLTCQSHPTSATVTVDYDIEAFVPSNATRRE
jgi:phenylacetate-CoA oxygenase/reductase PaaK subunit